MWRLPYTVIRNIIILPGILKKMQRMVRVEKCNEEECYVYANHIVDLMQKKGHIRTVGFGMENLTKKC